MIRNEPQGEVSVLRSRLIGKIILADLLEYPQEKFTGFIQEVEQLSPYKNLFRKGIITRRYLPDAKVLRGESPPSGAVAKIKNDGRLSIHYIKVGLSIEYIIDNEKLQRVIIGGRLTKEDKEDINGLLHKLRRINTRNWITHKILEGILDYQRVYFETSNELDLKPLRVSELARVISKKNNGDTAIDSSRISRVIRGMSVISPQGKAIVLRVLFPTGRDIIKYHIKALLAEEREDMLGDRLKAPYTDEQLSRKLDKEHGLPATRRVVAYCRKALGIPPYSSRMGYPPLSANFSPIHPFTGLSVKNNAPKCPGVYELRLYNAKIDYPNGSCEILYIGSGRNLRKRLLSHLSPNSKNGGIRRFVREKGCVFRYLQGPKGWEREEKMLYNLFVATFGDSPLCNHASPRAK
jgi:RNA polymerase sigma-54 factor